MQASQSLIKATLLIAFCIIAHISINAQNRVPLGLEEVIDSAYLEVTDPLIDNVQYYKFITLEMKAGSAVFAYMESGNFTPLMALVDAAGVNTTVGESEDLGGTHISYVRFNPERDTTISLLFTSVSALATGKFNYGVKRFSPQQMLYLEDFTLCEKFTYMINHWQAAWMLYDTYTYYDVFDEFGFFVTTDQSLQADTRPQIRNGIYSEQVENSTEAANAMEAYTGYITELTACLNKDQWNIHEVKGEGILTTYFTLKGFEDEITRASICVEMRTVSETEHTTTIRFF